MESKKEYVLSTKQRENMLNQRNKLLNEYNNKAHIIVHMLLEENQTIFEIASFFGESVNSIKKYLKKDRLRIVYPENYLEILAQVNAKIQDNYLKIYKISRPIPKLRIDIFSQIPEKQYRLICHMALTFRLKLSLMQMMFPEEVFALYNSDNLDSTLDNGLFYLENADATPQEMALTNFLRFYQSYVLALKNKNPEKRKQILLSITDNEAVNLIKRRNNGATFTENDFGIMLKYRLKYALPYQKVSETFKVSSSFIRESFKIYLLKHPEYSEEYQRINEFNQNLHFEHKGVGNHRA